MIPAREHIERLEAENSPLRKGACFAERQSRWLTGKREIA